ncbi:hypothetical protein [Pseudolactococcus insecticola]|uniref:Protein ComX n=1 Tax=Pseudolactococcus insecticola TaxID=2709158 RepID=A0A6A0B5K6_9LACT|nr:hypothetical protein [Lactococcus insecticola]GFH40512.1 protein ComX [Lactococcus insecticola]
MDKIEVILKNIEPIIMNCKKKANIPSWEIEDYMQEGMIVALELYNQILLADKEDSGLNFYVYFKVKYSQFLIDAYRKSQAYKRRYELPDYAEISLVRSVADEKQGVAENFIYELLFNEITEILTPAELITFQDLLDGRVVDRNKKYRLKAKIIRFLFGDV